MSTPEILKAERWLTLWNILIIAGAALTAIATFFVIRYGDKVSFLKDNELAHFQAEAQRDIAQANQKAQEAIKGQKQLEQRAAQLNHENLELEVRLEKERLNRLELEGKLASRRITVQQQETAVHILSAFKGSSIVINTLGDSEAQALAQQIIAIMDKAGWRTQVNASGYVSPPMYGLVLEIPNHVEKEPAMRPW